MTVRHQTPIYVCDICAAEEIVKDGPEDWLYIPPSLGRPSLHVCVMCQGRPIRELRLVMAAAVDGDVPALRRRQP